MYSYITHYFHSEIQVKKMHYIIQPFEKSLSGENMSFPMKLFSISVVAFKKFETNPSIHPSWAPPPPPPSYCDCVMMFKLDVVVEEGIIDLEPGGLESSSSSSYYQTQKSKKYWVCPFSYIFAHWRGEEMR
jgi:hypothetical protein